MPRHNKPECLILANGPSLLGREWAAVPRGKVYILGVNASWRAVPDADGHVAIDSEQFRIPEAAGYYDRVAKAGSLFHTKGGGALGVRLDRHDELKWGRFPFRKRHRGQKNPPPPLEQDGGVVLKVGVGNHDSGGSTAYIAAQIAVGMGFETIWIVGLDGGPAPTHTKAGLVGGAAKFTGQRSNSHNHYHLWRCVPEDVRPRLRIIAPSLTAEQSKLPVYEWPWKGESV